MITYSQAGVDVEAGYESVRLMRDSVRSTFIDGVMSDIGGFGGLFSLGAFKGMEEPVLVSGTDGVGTKIKLAFLADRHDTVGIDCVAMCVNDIICSGATPLFFLDYIACGKNYPEKIAAIVSGVAAGCRQAGCALIGGETAEHPGLMPEDEYDLAGFAVGIADRKNLIDGSRIKEGDAVIGLASSGFHSNGFSLIRKVFNDRELLARPELLTPTRIYVSDVAELRKTRDVKGLCHITGGGFIENLPRMLPDGLGIEIGVGWEIPPIIGEVVKRANLSAEQAFNTFNMGIGLAAVVPPEQTEGFRVIGKVVNGGGVKLL